MGLDVVPDLASMSSAKRATQTAKKLKKLKSQNNARVHMSPTNGRTNTHTHTHTHANAPQIHTHTHIHTYTHAGTEFYTAVADTKAANATAVWPSPACQNKQTQESNSCSILERDKGQENREDTPNPDEPNQIKPTNQQTREERTPSMTSGSVNAISYLPSHHISSSISSAFTCPSRTA